MSDTEINMRFAAGRFLKATLGVKFSKKASAAALELIKAIILSQDAEEKEQQAKETKP